MGLIIRPSPAVFRRGTPLFLIAGAFAPVRQAAGFGPEQSQSFATERTLIGWVRSIRRYRAALGFLREAPRHGLPPNGHWLETCRPTVTDRVFDLVEGERVLPSALLSCLDTAPQDGLILCGDPSDSLFQRCFVAASALRRDVRTLTATTPLHKCTTARTPEAFLLMGETEQHDATSALA